MPAPIQPPFRFDPALSLKENIDRFLAHLRRRDPELSELFAAQLSGMLPLPQDAQERAARRLAFNAAIAAALDADGKKP